MREGSLSHWVLLSQFPAPTEFHPSHPISERCSSPLLPCTHPTAADPSRLSQLLPGYDPTVTTFLVKGFTNGFRIPWHGSIPPLSHKVLQSAERLPHIIDEKLTHAIALGNIAGPFTVPPFHHHFTALI